MQRNLGRVAGASAAVAVIGLVVATGFFSRQDKSPPVAAAPAAPQLAEPVPDPIAGLQAEAAGLRTEIERLNAELAARSAAFDAQAAALTGREADVRRLTDLLAQRDQEIADLETRIAELQRQAEFDEALTALKGDVGIAQVETARVELPAGRGEASRTPDPASEGMRAASASGPQMRAVSEIHFDPSSSRLSPGGQAHAAAAAVTLRDLGIQHIRVVGYTDRVGGLARNRALAESRARTVGEFLISAGLPASAIEIVGMGETELPVATADGIAEPLNRCVTIEVLPL